VAKSDKLASAINHTQDKGNTLWSDGLLAVVLCCLPRLIT